MPAKTATADFLDDKALVLPRLLDAAIIGNERAKYVLSLLQMAASYAERPQQAVAPSLQTDREACGIHDTSFDRSVAESIGDGQGNFHIPAAQRLVGILDDALQAMLAPLALVAGESTQSRALHERYHERLDRLVAARPSMTTI
jgi:hypothetical protein